MRRAFVVTALALSCTALSLPSSASVQTWDAWVYEWARVSAYTVTIGEFGPVYNWYTYDIYNPNPDTGGNPVECTEEYYYAHFPDRFRFTFDGNSLQLKGTHIQSVGGSSSTACDLLLSGSWAVCGTVAGGILTPDPYATFIGDGNGGSIQWAANTPFRHTANLLVGYSFAGDGAATYYPNFWSPPPPPWDSVQGTLMIRRYSPYMGYGYPDSYTGKTHSFSVTYVPEPGGLLTLGVGGLGARLGLRRPRRDN